MAKKPGSSRGFGLQKQGILAKTGPNGHGVVESANTQLLLFPVKQFAVGGAVAMGVLNDGTPYLTVVGLAKMCGVDHAVISRVSTNWSEERTKPRGKKIQEILHQSGYFESQLTLPQIDKEFKAFPSVVCIAILEYYAFHAGLQCTDEARKNLIAFARESFEHFVYERCQYDPTRQLSQSWQNFHDRVLLNDQVPLGFFSVFREMADILVHLIKADCSLDDQTVPDISVGRIWSTYWEGHGFDALYNDRRRHPHYYPESFRQSQVNPVDAWIYPISALGEFRMWLYTEYLPKNFPTYVKNKIKQGALPGGSAVVLLASLQRPDVPGAVRQISQL
jgi:hypothetical protein